MLSDGEDGIRNCQNATVCFVARTSYMRQSECLALMSWASMVMKRLSLLLALALGPR